jgi:hypothetical protein
MLFLVLIGTLALGFYTSVTTATALSKNDRRTAKGADGCRVRHPVHA